MSSVQVSSVQDGFQSSGKATDHPISQDISPALPVALETVQMSGYPNMQLGFSEVQLKPAHATSVELSKRWLHNRLVV